MFFFKPNTYEELSCFAYAPHSFFYFLVTRTLRRLGKSSVLGLSHLLLDILKENLEALGEGSPVRKRREAGVNNAITLIHIRHVDLRDKTDFWVDLGVVGTSHNDEFVHAALVSSLKKRCDAMRIYYYYFFTPDGPRMVAAQVLSSMSV